jgi:hypothetical protein
MRTGRPTKYNEELIRKAHDYLHNYESEGDVFPQVAGLAVFLGISRETIYDWIKDDTKKDFSDIVAQICAMQEKVLVNGGIMGEFNASIAKLMLAKHGYSEKQEVDHTTKGDKIKSIAPHQFISDEDKQ